MDADVNDGLLRQEVAVATAAPGVLAYVDRVTARQNVTVTEERGLPVGVENDEVTGNRRRLITQGGKQTVIGGEQKDHALPGSWVNIDGRLGLVTARGSSLLYRAAGKPNRPGAREDILIGAHRSGPRSFAKGGVVADRAGLLLPDASPEETGKIATTLRVERGKGGTTLRFTGPDGRRHALALDEAGAVRWNDRSIRPRQTAGKAGQRSEHDP